MSENKKGLLVDVIGTDCTNGGATSGKTRAILIGDGIPEIFEPSDDAPAIELHYEFEPQGAAPGYVMVARADWASQVLGRRVGFNENLVARARAGAGMFGVHFVTTSDIRFPFTAPIPVFDRYETPEQYEQLSR